MLVLRRVTEHAGAIGHVARICKSGVRRSPRSCWSGSLQTSNRNGRRHAPRGASRFQPTPRLSVRSGGTDRLCIVRSVASGAGRAAARGPRGPSHPCPRDVPGAAVHRRGVPPCRGLRTGRVRRNHGTRRQVHEVLAARPDLRRPGRLHHVRRPGCRICHRHRRTDHGHRRHPCGMLRVVRTGPGPIGARHEGPPRRGRRVRRRAPVHQQHDGLRRSASRAAGITAPSEP